MTEHHSSRSRRAWTLVGCAVVLATLAVAWADHVSNHGQKVARNVAFLDIDVSGMPIHEVEDVVSERAEEVHSTDVVVDVGDDVLMFDAGELGFSYQTDLVIGEIMDARHTGGFARQLLAWLSSPLQPVELGDHVDYTPKVAGDRLQGDPALVLADPVEPVITMDGEDHFQVVEGVEGGVVDVGDLVARLTDESPESGEVRLDAKRSGLAPTVSDDRAREAAASLNEVTEDGVGILVGSAGAKIGHRLLRRHVSAVAIDGEIAVDFDAERLHTLLEAMFSEPVTDMVAPTFAVEDDTPVVIDPGEPPLTCCDLGSVRRAAEMIMAGASGPLSVRARPVDDPELIAWASGELVVEKVGEFTTRHSCCESRVNNIQRIADIVRGIYLLPGESVSLNEYVGRRTREKGFVAAGAIRSGHLESEVGGGVSQFATTIFNAAFFSGLDIPVYQAHSLYFSRYPFGREATISHPAPDLVLENSTDHPVLIWTSYTGTSITVSMYSTKHVDVADVGQRVARWNRCTHVETDRQRTYPNGLVVVDTFEALYRPADGIDCNGNVIPQS